MALLAGQSALLFVGQTFLSIEEARSKVLDASVSEGLSFKVEHSNQTRFIVICRSKKGTGCPFYIRIAAQTRTGEIELRKLIHHTCDITNHEKWKRTNSSKLIADRHSDLIKSDLKTKPRQIQNIERLNFSNQVPYLQAWRARKEVRNSAFLDKTASYQLIYPFLESITDRGLDSDTEEDAGGNYAMSRANAAISRDSKNQFEWCYVAPRACIKAFWHSRRFICLDGAHMKSERDLVLLIVTTLDANENTLPLMWGFAHSESKESWTNFLYGFREYFLDSITDSEKRDYFERLSIVSDRGKGLVPAVAEVLPKAFHYHCTQHLAANIGTEFGKKIEKIFRAGCLVDGMGKFRVCLDQIESLSAPARHYIDQINTKNYATSAAPLVDFPRYGQTCSNIAESVNSALMEARELPLLYSLHHIWIYLMKKFYERRHDTQRHEKFTNYCMACFTKELEDSHQYLIIPQERENQVAIAYRAQASDQSTRIVHLKAGKCTCLAFQDHKIPCRHAIAVARFFQVDPMSLIADFYQISEYREQYKYTFELSLLSDLEPDGITQPPPAVAVPRGRKVVKRLKRVTRETEARRFARMKSPETQRRRQEEARARYQSGASHFQLQTSIAVSNRNQLSTAYHNPLAALNRQSRRNDPFPLAQPPDLSDTWARIRALQASASEIDQLAGQRRTVMNQLPGESGDQAQDSQEDWRNTEGQARQPEQPVQASNEQPDASAPSASRNDDERPFESTTIPSSSPSSITYNFQGPVNGFFNLSGSASMPQFTQNVTPSPPRKRSREEDDESGNEDDDEVEVVDPVIVRRSRRPQKKSRKARNID
jgi:hypothetical protein